MPALQAVDRGREQQRQEQRDGDRNEDVLREIQHRAHRQERQQDDRFAQRGVGERRGCTHRTNVGHSRRTQTSLHAGERLREARAGK